MGRKRSGVDAGKGEFEGNKKEQFDPFEKPDKIWLRKE